MNRSLLLAFSGLLLTSTGLVSSWVASRPAAAADDCDLVGVPPMPGGKPAKQAIPAKVEAEVKKLAGSTGATPEYEVSSAPDKDAVEPKETFCEAVYASPGLEYCRNEKDHHKFTLKNSKSPKTNPIGSGAYRTYSFIAPQRARQDLALEIGESGCTLGYDCKDSEWTMESILVFFPRKVLPSIRLVNEGAAFEVTIPTGEKILFDATTREIIGGALKETAPIDMGKDRFKRKFAALKYTGNGIVVRSDQRGESPRAAVVWGAKKTAIISWGDKTCRVSNADIWLQKENEGGLNRYSTDDSFYEMLRTKCKWNVSADNFKDAP